MQEHTKYKIGDKVWMLRNERAQIMTVIAVVILKDKKLYGLRICDKSESYKEFSWGKLKESLRSLFVTDYSYKDDEISLHAPGQFFPTKQALINSL